METTIETILKASPYEEASVGDVDKYVDNLRTCLITRLKTARTLAAAQAADQKAMIADILEHEGQIDNFRAIHERISLRLGARVHELRQRGWEIDTEEMPDKNTVYRLLKLPEAKQLAIL